MNIFYKKKVRIAKDLLCLMYRHKVFYNTMPINNLYAFLHNVCISGFINQIIYMKYFNFVEKEIYYGLFPKESMKGSFYFQADLLEEYIKQKENEKFFNLKDLLKRLK